MISTCGGRADREQCTPTRFILERTVMGGLFFAIASISNTRSWTRPMRLSYASPMLPIGAAIPSKTRVSEKKIEVYRFPASRGRPLHEVLGGGLVNPPVPGRPLTRTHQAAFRVSLVSSGYRTSCSRFLIRFCSSVVTPREGLAGVDLGLPHPLAL